MEDEVIVFADRDLEEDLLSQLRSANIQVGDTTTRSVGTAMRIIAKDEPSKLFGVALKWWEANRKSGVLVTFRASSGLTVELNDSSMPEVRKIIESRPK